MTADDAAQISRVLSGEAEPHQLPERRSDDDPDEGSTTADATHTA